MRKDEYKKRNSCLLAENNNEIKKKKKTIFILNNHLKLFRNSFCDSPIFENPFNPI